MNHKVRKQFLPLAGHPILYHTLRVFKGCKTIDRIILVIPEGEVGLCRKNVLGPLNMNESVTLVHGGRERQDSVYNGLCELEAESGGTEDVVVIHDGVRPFIRTNQIEACIDQAEEFGACIMVLPVVDTLKHITESGFITKTIDRETIRIAQTPQAFRYSIIKRAHEQARELKCRCTDDASLVERLGIDVKPVNGSRLNIKITTSEDLLFGEAILADGLI